MTTLEYDPEPMSAGELGAILGVWAHPDDEAYLCGALMSLAIQRGQRVRCVTATRGELGTDDPETFPPEKLARIRTDELEACMSVLGVTDHLWLDYPDGGCGDLDPEEPVARITELIREFRPDTVLTFGPEGMTDHVDHKAVSRWTAAGVQRAALPDTKLYYATKSPEWAAQWAQSMEDLDVMMSEEAEPPITPRTEMAIDFRAEDELLDRKERALRCMGSQIDPLRDAVGPQVFRDLIAEEPFRYP